MGILQQNVFTNKTFGQILDYNFRNRGKITLFEYVNPSESDHKIIFSTENVLLLIFYSYKDYGQMTVSLEIQTTRFKVFTHDVCRPNEYRSSNIAIDYIPSSFDRLPSLSYFRLLAVRKLHVLCKTDVQKIIIQILQRPLMVSKTCNFALFVSKECLSESTVRVSGVGVTSGGKSGWLGTIGSFRKAKLERRRRHQ